MAVDWVRMRSDLYRDPKVCVMADHLVRSVTGDVTGDGSVTSPVALREITVALRALHRNAVVGALVTVWGTCRHRGKRVGDDLVITNCTQTVIDDISDLAGFGEAMLNAGWLRVTAKGLIFPNFFEELNAEPATGGPSKAAERQRRYREKLARNCDVTGDGRVAQRDAQRNAGVEKSREEKRRVENTPPTPPGGGDGGRDAIPADGTERDGEPTRDRKRKPRTADLTPAAIESAELVDADSTEDVPDFRVFMAEWSAAKLLGYELGEAQRTPNRVGWWQQRLRTPWWAKNWRAGIDRLAVSEKAKGNGDFARGVRIDDFLKNPDYLTRILEGEFDDRTPPARAKAAETIAEKLARKAAEKAKAEGGVS